jgi:hypothetical protein
MRKQINMVKKSILMRTRTENKIQNSRPQNRSLYGERVWSVFGRLEALVVPKRKLM